MNIYAYDYLSTKLREFLKKKKFVECHTQEERSILSACENIDSIVDFTFGGTLWPMPQSGQMILERELLENPEVCGVFTFSTSFRNEPDPIPGRHDLIFGMMEFESWGGMKELLEFERELLVHLGLIKENLPEIRCSYKDVAKYFNTDIIEAEHETKMYEEQGENVIFLMNFPEISEPFFNMKRNENGTSQKCDVIVKGMESIGSAVRECDVEKMREKFLTIVDGEYARTLFHRFGKNRVMAELEKYLKLPMLPRYGGGIGLTRLEKAFPKDFYEFHYLTERGHS